MEAGVGMVYPIQCIDGCVHLLGGQELKAYLKDNYPNGCPVGSAVSSPSFGELTYGYGIVHAVAPLYTASPTWVSELKRTYHSALNESIGLASASSSSPPSQSPSLASLSRFLPSFLTPTQSSSDHLHRGSDFSREEEEDASSSHIVVSIATPLLGTGAKGGAIGEGAQACAESVVDFCRSVDTDDPIANASVSSAEIQLCVGVRADAEDSLDRAHRTFSSVLVR